LAAIAIPTFLAQRDKANRAACQSDVRNAAEAAQLYATNNNGSYAGLDEPTLEANGYNPTSGVAMTVPTATAAKFTLSATCPGGVGTSTFDSDTGVVTGP
jgi:type IV pilus assembly protein PilA